jgi:hypothetical protein
VHVHWHRVIRSTGYGNEYLECRCGHRKIKQRERGQPVDWRWVDGGDFRAAPPTGPGPSGSSSGRSPEGRRIGRHSQVAPQTAMIRAQQGRPPVPPRRGGEEPPPTEQMPAVGGDGP